MTEIARVSVLGKSSSLFVTKKSSSNDVVETI